MLSFVTKLAKERRRAFVDLGLVRLGVTECGSMTLFKVWREK